jgi:hypothetical protein
MPCPTAATTFSRIRNSRIPRTPPLCHLLVAHRFVKSVSPVKRQDSSSSIAGLSSKIPRRSAKRTAKRTLSDGQIRAVRRVCVAEMFRTHFAYRMLYCVFARQNIDRAIGKTAKASPVAHDVKNVTDPGMMAEASYLRGSVGV